MISSLSCLWRGSQHLTIDDHNPFACSVPYFFFCDGSTSLLFWRKSVDFVLRFLQLIVHLMQLSRHMHIHCSLWQRLTGGLSVRGKFSSSSLCFADPKSSLRSKQRVRCAECFEPVRILSSRKQFNLRKWRDLLLSSFVIYSCFHFFVSVLF